MNPPKNRRGATSAFPNQAETLALRASLLDGEPALEAWRTLGQGLVETPGIAWIAPLLMANLRRLAPEDPWVRGNPHFLALAELQAKGVCDFAERAIGILEAAGVPTLALKGLALGATVYPTPGLRTVSDIDLLVPRKDFFKAAAALKAAGLKAGAGEPAADLDLRANHAHVYSSSKRHQPAVDLHWHVLASARNDDDDDPFWAAAVPITVGKTRTRALGPEHQLAHALIHGVRWTRMPHVRWVADVVLILRQSKGLDVEAFVETLARFDGIAAARAGLEFVVQEMGEGGEILARLRTVKQSRFSERAIKARSTAYEDRTFADRLALRVEDALWRRRASRPPTGSRTKG